MFRRISRRAALKGLGASIALPWLEGMRSIIEAAAPARPELPVRTAFIYVPNGVHLPDWSPRQSGSAYALPWSLEPLARFKKDINVLSGLTLDKARSHGDGPGDHARAMSAFLTGCQPRKTNGSDIRVGQSADQWIAGKIGERTRFPSLELGIEPGRPAGNCEFGYSCVYQSNISWRNESTPNPKEINPRLVFERLFGNGPPGEKAAGRARREQLNKSILDFVREDARSLGNELGANDRRKLDEYLTSIRDIERRIDTMNEARPVNLDVSNIRMPEQTPRDFHEHVRLMADLMILAFQADLTRVITFPFANDGSNRSYPFLAATINDRDEPVREGHHELSHHGGDAGKQAKIRSINRFHVEQLAYILDKMHSVVEGGRTLLDQVMIVYGSGNADGNRHNHDNLPILLCGPGGGKIRTGRHLNFPPETPLMNLYVTMFQALGFEAKSFGDSTGPLPM